MVENELLRWVIVAPAMLVALMLTVLLGHAALVSVRGRRRAPREERVRVSLRAAPEEGSPASAGAALRRLPSRRRAELLAELGFVSGDGRAVVAQVAEAGGLSAAAEGWCSSRRWWVRLRGARVLTQIGGGEHAVPNLFSDPHAAVRASAAWWAALLQTDRAHLRRVVTLLDDPAPLCRFAAKDALMRSGKDSVPLIRSELEATTPTRLVGLLDVAIHIASPELLPAALEYCNHSEDTVRRRAATLAGSIGGAVAVDTLVMLLGDADDGVRAAAADALGQLGHWPAAPRLAQAMADPAWDVRKAAGLSLDRLGAPGRLYLQRTRAGPDRFAADLARQILDLHRDDASAAR